MKTQNELLEKLRQKTKKTDQMLTIATTAIEELIDTKIIVLSVANNVKDGESDTVNDASIKDFAKVITKEVVDVVMNPVNAYLATCTSRGMGMYEARMAAWGICSHNKDPILDGEPKDEEVVAVAAVYAENQEGIYEDIKLYCQTGQSAAAKKFNKK